jgi:leukotriene-A4 hydrolase
MKHDPHSFSRPQEARVTHLNWNAFVDFDKRCISATASWQIEAAAGVKEIVLDTRSLKISKVTTNNRTRDARFRLGEEDPILGQALTIELQPDTRSVEIVYETGPHAEALQWLEPQQTAGKQHPFLFTQSQAILARSWVPCQDSPGVRFTYQAAVAATGDLMILMSASNPQHKVASGNYDFEMKQPIPSYLLALTVGDVVYKPVSDRAGVYAEPAMIERAAWEFADLEKMIAGAEDLYGPYRWERYDVIVLPPSFPFGGMENPRLTFATPTILAGDRSLTSLIAHELAHSWSGNLVTNATWNDFWLNEGFTVYFETRIMEKLYGRDYAEMLASLNLQDLKDEVEELRKLNQYDDTKLLLHLDGRNPDDGVTAIAYNKGYFFLRSIEAQFGRDKFDQFVRDYFSDHAFKAMDTDTFRKYIRHYYQSRFGIAISDAQLDRWIMTEGLPDDLPQPLSTRFAQVDALLKEVKGDKLPDRARCAGWSTHEWLHFLKNVPPALLASQMAALDAFGGFTASGNAELICAWSVLAVRHGYAAMNLKIEDFLIHTGRRKFLVPIYTELAKTPGGMVQARAIYAKARPNYHFVATSTFDRLLA